MKILDIKSLVEELEKSTKQDDGLLEAKSRMIIGRCHYCAYHLCLENKETISYYDDDGKKISHHVALVKAYQKSKDQNEQDIGDELEKLRKKRNIADYHLDRFVSFKSAKRCITILKKIIILLDKVKESNLLEAILTKDIFNYPNTKNLIELKNEEKLQTICKNNPDLDKFLFEHVIEVDKIYKPNKIIIQANDDKINIYPETKLTADEISEKDKAFATWMSKRNYGLDNLITYHK